MRALTAVILLLAAVFYTGESSASGPKENVAEVLSAFEKLPQGGDAKSQVIAALDKYLDYEGITEFVFGKLWEEHPAYRQKFTEFFTRFLREKVIRITYYVERLEFSIVREDKISSSEVEVYVDISVRAFKDTTNVRLAAKMHPKGGEWKIYNLVITDSKEKARELWLLNYRAQIAAKFRKAAGSVEETLSILNEHLR